MKDEINGSTDKMRNKETGQVGTKSRIKEIF